jgi:hypothetical protein
MENRGFALQLWVEMTLIINIINTDPSLSLYLSMTPCGIIGSKAKSYFNGV